MGIVCILLLACSALCAAVVPQDSKPDAEGFTANPLRDEFTVKPLRAEASVSIEEFKKYIGSDRIVGGSVESPPHSHPWQALVLWGDELCGGTILNSNFVLTAAHCVPSNQTAPSSIIAGASTWCEMSSTGATSMVTEPSQQRRSVKTLHRLGGSMAYGSNGHLFDIALLEVDSPFTMNEKVVAANLPTSRTPAGTNLVVSGWGATSEGGKISCSLKHLSVPLVSNTDCNASYGNIRSSQICAGFREGGRDSCQGDSGGPLVAKSSSSDATVVGVVSFGAGCARPNFFGVYSDVYTFLPWINTVLSGSTWSDCSATATSRIGDGTCNDDLNNAACFLDAGDCASAEK